MQMMFERGASAGVHHIRLQEVLRRVGLTSGAAYRLWADQEEYQRDLAVALVELRLGPPDAGAGRAVEQLIASGSSFDEVLIAGTASHLIGADLAMSERDSRESRLFLTVFALRSSAQTWPELQAASRRRHEESVAVFADFYRRIMLAYRMRMREPFAVEDFTEAMAALGEGFALRSVQGLDHVEFNRADPRRHRGVWSLFAVAARGLVDEFIETEPDPA